MAITGDSFTEGQGSNSSWVSSIQRRLCDQGQNSVNLAISGYGLEDMKDSLDYAYEKLGAKKAIVAIIPNDIYRGRVPMTSNLTCSMFQSSNCGDKVTVTWWHHNEGLNPTEIIAFASTKYNFGILEVLKDLNFNLKKMIKYNNNYFGNSKRKEN